jgi:hypothetical protein
MKTKIVILILILGILIAAGVIIYSRSSTAQTDDDTGSLAWIARKIRAQGGSQAERLVSVLHPGISGFDEAKAKYSVIEAQLVSSQSYPLGTDNIITWNKFRITNTLSTKPVDCTACLEVSPPGDLFPLNPNEVLVPSGDGTLVIDGVTISDREHRLPTYDMSGRYVLFLDLNNSTQVGTVTVGPVGALAIMDDGSLSPMHEGSPIWSDLASRGITTVDQLRRL